MPLMPRKPVPARAAEAKAKWSLPNLKFGYGVSIDKARLSKDYPARGEA